MFKKVAAAATIAAALAGCATPEAPLRFDAVGIAHVVTAGEPVDPAAAYVVVVPHFSTRAGYGELFMPGVVKTSANEFRAWLSTVPAFGAQPVKIAVDVANDRPTVLRLPPGHWYVDKVFSDAAYYDVQADYSQFDAIRGQVNYPGDWTVESGAHELTRGARHIGWYWNVTLAEGGNSDLGKLVPDSAGAVAKLPRAYTRQQAAVQTIGDR